MGAGDRRRGHKGGSTVSSSGYSNPPESEQSASSVDAAAVARAKREIQGLVQEIAALSRSEVDPSDFYDALLNKVVAALAAIGGAVWMLDETGGLQLEYQINLRESGLAGNAVGQAQHGRLLQQVLDGGDGTLISPHSGTGDATDGDPRAAANPTDHLLVLAPVSNDQGPQGVVEVFQRTGARPATQRGYLRFLMQTCELAGDYLRSRRLRDFTDKQSLWQQLETFTRVAHQNLDVRQTAYTIANEGRRLIGCDRLSVAVQHGSRCPIEAISGQDTFDKRSNQVSLLGKLAAAVTRTGEAVWYTGDATDLAPQVEKAIDDYVDEAHTKTLAVLPLLPDSEEEEPSEDDRPTRRHVIGALVVEQMVDSQTPESMKQRVDVVRAHSATALANAQEHEGLFLMPLWKTLGKARWLITGRTLPKTVAVIAAIVATILALTFVPADFALEGEANLRPLEKQFVFAQIDGVVKELYVAHGDKVTADQLLAQQISNDLDLDLKKFDGQIQETLAKEGQLTRLLYNGDLTDDQSSKYVGELETLYVQKESLQNQWQLLNDKREKLAVRAPIDGVMITWKVDDRILGRPVRQGQRLMEIVDPAGDWELEVRMPESRMGHISAAQAEADGRLKVEFILQTHPDETLQGTVEKIDVIAEPRGEEGNTVLIRVAFNQQELRAVMPEPKVNADATAKIFCGQRPIGYVWLHDLFDFVQSKILFRL